MRQLRPCDAADTAHMLDIINAAAGAYRGVIPADRWHEPYMAREELERELGAGVRFWGCAIQGELAGVMGVQSVRDVDLIRHAYVKPGIQRSGIGAALLEHLVASTTRRMLVGTWSDARWAISFYERHGFELASPARAAELLRQYWSIPQRQIDCSVVLELNRNAGS